MTGRVGGAKCRSGGFVEYKSEKKNYLKLRSDQNKIIGFGSQTAIILFLKCVSMCIKKMQKYRILSPSTLKTKLIQISQRVALTNILTFRLMTEQIY
jgi:hypothetical protein